LLGMTTFGKGLVQRQYTLKDGSALLLTVARYYTPSGRLIQRDYSDRSNYASEEAIEAAETETEEAEEGKIDLPKYNTDGGRTVYGGGGITPDIKVTYSRKLTEFQTKLEREQIIHEFANNYANSKGMKRDNDFEAFLKSWEVDDATMDQFRHFLDDKNKSADKDHLVSYTPEEFKVDSPYVRQAIKREVARNVWGEMMRYRVAIEDDEMIEEAMKHFNEAALMARNMDPKTDR
jgi:carboxyl-terminal processing protease